jgi:polysaccharide biosynthesis transport protein
MDSNQSSPEVRLHFLDYWRVIRTRKVIVLVVFLLVVLTTAVVTYLQPKVYAAATRIKVEQEKLTVELFGKQSLPSYDPYFLQTQYEIIQSQKILYPTIERVNLQKRWAEAGPPLTREDAYKRLKAQMQVRRFRDTSLIEIVVFDHDPRLAAEIATVIAQVFERDRLDVKRQQTMKGLVKLNEQLAEQLEKWRAAQNKVERLRKELNVPVIGLRPLSDQNLTQLDSLLTAAKVEAVTRETRLAELRKLTPEQLRNAIVTIVADANIQALLQSLTQTELKLEVLKEDFGPDHPSVRAAMAERDKLQEQITARIDGVMRGFEVEGKIAQERVNELKKQLDAARSSTVTLEGEQFLPFRNAQREEEMASRLYETLSSRVQQESIELESPRSSVELIDEAEPDFRPVKPNMVLNLVLGGILGIFLGIALTFFIEFLDTSVKIMEDVERYLGLPVLGVIPQQTVLLTRPDASPAHLEAYRMLRTNIDFTLVEGEHKSFAVLSAGASEGKSFTLANLAFVFAQQGSRVLVVDSDLRRPSVHKNLGVSADNGLSDYLTGSKTVDDIIRPTNIPNVSIITAGTGESAKAALPLLTSQRMNQLIQEVSHRYDVVLYDTPPVLGISDATVVAREVGSAILVVQHRRFPRAMSQRARKMVENAGGRLLGVVVNNVNVGKDDSYYYYYHDHYETYMRPIETTNPATPAASKKLPSDEIKLPEKY